MGAAGKNYDRLIVPAGGVRLPAGTDDLRGGTDASGCTRNQQQLFMDGPAIFHFALYKVKDFLKDCCNAEISRSATSIWSCSTGEQDGSILLTRVSMFRPRSDFTASNTWATAAGPRFPRCWPRHGAREK